MAENMADIAVRLQDGEPVTVASPITVKEILGQLLSGKQRKKTIAAYANNVAVDLDTELTSDAVLQPIQTDSDKGLEILRHSTAHVMAQAVRDIYGTDVKIAIGPAIENGFYYDFLRNEPFSPDDFNEIERRMAEIAAASLPFSRTEVDRITAHATFREQGEKYKTELLEEFEVDTVSIYQQGDFTDLCRGPHLPDTSWIQELSCSVLLAPTGVVMRKKTYSSVSTARCSSTKRN